MGWTGESKRFSIRCRRVTAFAGNEDKPLLLCCHGKAIFSCCAVPRSVPRPPRTRAFLPRSPRPLLRPTSPPRKLRPGPPRLEKSSPRPVAIGLFPFSMAGGAESLQASRFPASASRPRPDKRPWRPRPPNEKLLSMRSKGSEEKDPVLIPVKL